MENENWRLNIMIITRLILKNWKNFVSLDVPLGQRVFVMGPNASGKSNLLDAISFLSDIARSSFQNAVYSRGGPFRLRCAAAGKGDPVEIEVHLTDSSGPKTRWIYALGWKLPKGPKAPLLLAYERVWKDSKQILSRPNESDSEDPACLTSTHIEQIIANADFRDIPAFLMSVKFHNPVPELMRHPHPFPPADHPGDPFGRKILQSMAKMPEKERKRTIKIISDFLKPAIPQLERLDLLQDAGGPHLQGTFEIGRPRAKHSEAYLSDGTLRAVALLWTFMLNSSTMLLESPETSIPPDALLQITRPFFVIARETKKQLIITAYTPYFLNDDIVPVTADEVVILMPGDQNEGTSACLASSISQIVQSMEEGVDAGEAVLPFCGPHDWVSFLQSLLEDGDL
jgi:predicted ATPase